MADAIVYVDGFNLYYGSLKRTPYKWLDLGRQRRRECSRWYRHASLQRRKPDL